MRASVSTRPAARAAALILALVVLALGAIAAPAHAAGPTIEVEPDDIGATVGDTTAAWTRSHGTNLEGRYEIVDDPADGSLLELETVGGAAGVGTQAKFMHYFASGAYPSIDGAATLVGTDPVASVPLADLLAHPVTATYRASTYLSLQIEIRYGVDKFATIYQNGAASATWTTFSVDPTKLWTLSGALTDAGGATLMVCGAAGTRACSNGQDVELADLLTGLAGQDPRAISVGVNKGRDSNSANAGLVQVRDISFGGETFVFVLPATPLPPVTPPVADSTELAQYIVDNAIDVETESDQFVTTGTVNTDLAAVVNDLPLNGQYENWTDSSDSFADVYSFSAAVHLGTFPIVGGHVILSGANITHLEPGTHHLLFIGQTSGAVRVVALTVIGLAATGAAPSSSLVGFGVLAIALGVVALSPHVRERLTPRAARPSRTGR